MRALQSRTSGYPTQLNLVELPDPRPGHSVLAVT